MEVVKRLVVAVGIQMVKLEVRLMVVVVTALMVEVVTEMVAVVMGVGVMEEGAMVVEMMVVGK